MYQVLSMAQRLNIAYYLASPQDADRIDSFKQCAGDSEKTLITQYVRGWIGRNREFYLDMARKDAEYRGISFRQWGEIVVNEGVESLPQFVTAIPDNELSTNPLASVVLAPNLERKYLNYIKLGVQNIALLRIGIYYSGDSAVTYISRIVKEHLDRNWESLYQSQVDAENFDNWH